MSGWFLTPGLQARYDRHNWREVIAMRLWHDDHDAEHVMVLFTDGSSSKILDVPENEPSTEISFRWRS